MAGTIPIFLISGFLGSGKSTLLSRLLHHEGFADTAVIVNEFGEVGIDHALIAPGQEENIVLLDSGCICCSPTSSLEDTLETLYYQRERGEIPEFSRVVVETTGLADPGPIATALSGGIFVARQFRLGAIVVTVDAIHGSEQIGAFDEARHQVALADRLILTKTDQASANDQAKTREAIAALNPSAPLETAVMGVIDPDLIAGEVHVAPPHPQHTPSADIADAHRHHIHAHGFVTVTVRPDGPISWADYARLVAVLTSEIGDNLLRVKGLIPFDDGVLRAIQGVRLLFSTPEPVARSASPESIGALVIIAKNIDPRQLHEAGMSIQGSVRAKWLEAGEAGP